MNEELEQFKKVQLKKARMTSVVLGLAAVIAVLSMVYSTTQSIEAMRQRDLSVVEKMTADKEIAALKEQLASCQSEKK